MNGQMMDFQLTLPPLLRRAETFFGEKQIVTRLPDKSFHRYTYAEMARRAKQLAVALGKASASSPATASPLSAGTTTSTWRRTSASRAAASCCTR